MHEKKIIKATVATNEGSFTLVFYCGENSQWVYNFVSWNAMQQRTTSTQLVLLVQIYCLSFAVIPSKGLITISWLAAVLATDSTCPLITDWGYTSTHAMTEFLARTATTSTLLGSTDDAAQWLQQAHGGRATFVKLPLSWAIISSTEWTKAALRDLRLCKKAWCLTSPLTPSQAFFPGRH